MTSPFPQQADKYVEVELELNNIAEELDETCEELVMAYRGKRERASQASFDNHIDDHHDEVKQDAAELKRLLALREEATKSKVARQAAIDDELARQQTLAGQIAEVSARLAKVETENLELLATRKSQEELKTASELNKSELQGSLEKVTLAVADAEREHAELSVHFEEAMVVLDVMTKETDGQ